jgi:dipeptidyl aminopeptidase/acylaminoacyl peptidase
MMPPLLRHPLVALLALVVLGAAAVAFLLAWRSYRGMHRLLEAGSASATLATPQQAGLPNLAKVSFESSDGIRLVGWYVPSVSGAAVVVAHGAMADRGTMLAELQLLADAGFGVLAFDWPGLGESAGNIRWDGQARRALLAAIGWLGSQPGVDPRRIGGLGFSMGGVILAQVAAEDARIRAMVLESAAPDFRDYVHVNSGTWGPLSEWAGSLALRNSGLLDPAFAASAVIGRISPRPVLIIGGTRDTAVPGASLHKLYEAAGEPKSLWMIEGAGHGNYHDVAAVPYAARLAGFFGSNLSAQ